MTAPLLVLEVRRVIKAPVERVFAAWLDPRQLQKWWGPPSMTCTHAEVDARTGGRYRARQHVRGWPYALDRRRVRARRRAA